VTLLVYVARTEPQYRYEPYVDGEVFGKCLKRCRVKTEKETVVATWGLPRDNLQNDRCSTVQIHGSQSGPSIPIHRTSFLEEAKIHERWLNVKFRIEHDYFMVVKRQNMNAD